MFLWWKYSLSRPKIASYFDNVSMFFFKHYLFMTQVVHFLSFFCFWYWHTYYLTVSVIHVTKRKAAKLSDVNWGMNLWELQRTTNIFFFLVAQGTYWIVKSHQEIRTHVTQLLSSQTVVLSRSLANTNSPNLSFPLSLYIKLYIEKCYIRMGIADWYMQTKWLQICKLLPIILLRFFDVYCLTCIFTYGILLGFFV